MCFILKYERTRQQWIVYIAEQWGDAILENIKDLVTKKTALLVGLLVPPSAQVFFLKSANQRGKRHYHGAAFDDLPTMSVR